LLFLAQNAPETAWRPGSTRTGWGSLSAPPDPLAAVKGLGTPGGEEKGRREGRREGTKGEGRRGSGGERKGEGMGREGREKGTGRGPQFKRNDPPSSDQMAGYGPVRLTRCEFQDRVLGQLAGSWPSCIQWRRPGDASASVTIESVFYKSFYQMSLQKSSS